jgi:hypothetical protein
MIETTTTLSEWQLSRLGKFTASEIYKLLTDPKTKEAKENGYLSDTAKSYILEKAVETFTGYRKQYSCDAMDHGVRNELEAFESFCEISGLDFEMTSSQFYSINEYSGASPDGVLYNDLDIVAVLDVKCPFSPQSFFEQKKMVIDSSSPKYQNVPKNYYYQMQMQMMATGSSKGYLARYLTSSYVDDYGNKYEFDLPLDVRLFYSEIHEDLSVQREIIDRIDKAESLKQDYIKLLKQKI